MMPSSGSRWDPGAVIRRWMVSTVLLLAALGASGCQNVKPWQRGTLGDVTMRPDRDPLKTTFNEHVWFSREAAFGGRGIGGGGCGCN